MWIKCGEVACVSFQNWQQRKGYDDGTTSNCNASMNSVIIYKQFCFLLKFISISFICCGTLSEFFHSINFLSMF